MEKKVRFDVKKLEELGISPTPDALNIDEVEDVFYPFYVGLLEKGDKQRLVAVDGIIGKLTKILAIFLLLI